jgi:hypothetical protein
VIASDHGLQQEDPGIKGLGPSSVAAGQAP